jgi:ABC-type transport system involved in multi-copper enzyme maturation permease subunit
MMSSLKAELRKIWTVRSTYATLIFCLVIMGIYAFWAEGIKAGDGTRAVTDPHKVAFLIRDAVSNLAFFGGLVAILSLANEYRYGTIMYTLTSSKSRGQILLSKIIAVTIFSIIFTLFVAILSPIMMYAGITIKGLSLAHQLYPADLIWRVFFGSWGYAMIGLLLASFIRQQVGTLATFFAFPLFLEALLGLVLKDNRIYLPFTALQQVTNLEGNDLHHVLSPGKAALVVVAYLLVGWAISWALFLRRDAI